MLFTLRNECIGLAVLYRPPSSSVSKFREEFEAYVDSIMTASGKLVAEGDFNFKMDESLDTDANKLKELLSSLNLKQHVTVGTHTQGRTLDLEIKKMCLKFHHHNLKYISDFCVLKPVLNSKTSNYLGNFYTRLFVFEVGKVYSFIVKCVKYFYCSYH